MILQFFPTLTAPMKGARARAIKFLENLPLELDTRQDESSVRYMESTQTLAPTFAIGDEIVHKGIGNRNLFWTVRSFHAGGIGVESHYTWGFIATRDLESYEIR